MLMRKTFAMFLLLAGCAHVPAEKAGEALGAVAWEKALAEGPRVAVIPMVTGEVEVEREFLLDFENAALPDRKEGKVWVPVVSYLVRHPEHGDLLIDTGFDHTFAESGHGNFGGLAFLVAFARQQPGHDTAALLGELKGEPRRIVLSHMHGDHTAGLPGLPRDIPVIVGAGATESYGEPWFAPPNHFDDRDEVRTLPAAAPGEAIDLFGDGSLLALPTPGHAGGNLSFLARAAGGPVLLTCDASHTREGLDHGVSPGGVDDRAAADASLARLRAFLAAHPEVRVKAGHERSDWDLSRGIQDPL